MRLRLASVLCSGVVAFGVAACSGGGTSPSGVGPDGGAGGVTLADGATVTPAPVAGGAGAEPHTPAAGCRAGFVACGASKPAVCAHVEDDYTHCGNCETMCSGGSCVDGKCVASSQACAFGAVCGAACIKNRGANAEHCGSCFNRCGDAALCVGGECVAGGGDGSSCASPLFWDPYDQERAGFRTTFSPGTTFVHPCGPLTAIPTKWFRFTGTKANTNVSVDGTVDTDAFVVTVFSSSACNEPVVVGCSADKVEPSVDVPNANGKTFFVAVGAVSVTAANSASIRVDH